MISWIWVLLYPSTPCNPILQKFPYFYLELETSHYEPKASTTRLYFSDVSKVKRLNQHDYQDVCVVQANDSIDDEFVLYGYEIHVMLRSMGMMLFVFAAMTSMLMLQAVAMTALKQDFD